MEIRVITTQVIASLLWFSIISLFVVVCRFHVKQKKMESSLLSHQLSIDKLTQTLEFTVDRLGKIPVKGLQSNITLEDRTARVIRNIDARTYKQELADEQPKRS